MKNMSELVQARWLVTLTKQFLITAQGQCFGKHISTAISHSSLLGHIIKGFNFHGECQPQL